MIRKFHNRQLPKGILIDRGLVFIRIFPSGKKFQQGFGPASDPANINLAIQKLNEYRQDVQLDKFGLEVPAKRIKFADGIVPLFLAQPQCPASYKTNVKALQAFLPDQWWDEVNYLRMQQYEEWRTKQIGKTGKLISKSTAMRELTTMSAIYYKIKALVELKELEPVKMPSMSPCKFVEKYDERLSRRSRVLSQDDEFPKFMSVATPRVQKVVLAALNTALSKKDLFNLGEKNVAEFGKQLEGERTKVGKLYTVPNNSNMQGLFGNGDQLLDDTNFRKEFEESRERFLSLYPVEQRDKRYFWFKDLRRTALRKVWDETKDILLCRDLAAHADVKTTQLYLGLRDTDVQLAGKVLEKAFSYSIENCRENCQPAPIVVEEKRTKQIQLQVL